jgi:hypothetical protein
VRIELLGEEVVVPRTASSLRDGLLTFWAANWGADLVGIRPAADSVRTLVSLGEVLGDPMSFVDLLEGRLPMPLWFRLWTVCGDERLRVWDRIGNQIRTFGPDGRQLGAVALPPDEIDRVTQRQFARAVLGLIVAETMGEVGGQLSPADSAAILDEALQQAVGEPEQLADLLPRYVDLRCSTDGTLWLHPFDLEVGGLQGGRVWLQMGEDGSVREVSLPDRFQAFRFTSDRIWGVQRDQLDVASVAWIDLGGRP